MAVAFSVLNLDALKRAILHKEPFPYLIVDQIFHPEALADVLNSFPKLSDRGSFPLNAVSCSGAFAQLMQELQSLELKTLIGELFDMDLKDNPVMITLRGHTTERDGHIHVDSTSKRITLLLYLNQNWQSPEGRLRLLYDKKNLEPYAAEVAPEAGRCLIFKVTDNCWHGHTPFIGERRSIQLNYVTSDEDRNRHLKRHRLSAFFKNIFRKKQSNETPSAY